MIKSAQILIKSSLFRAFKQDSLTSFNNSLMCCVLITNPEEAWLKFGCFTEKMLRGSQPAGVWLDEYSSTSRDQPVYSVTIFQWSKSLTQQPDWPSHSAALYCSGPWGTAMSSSKVSTLNSLWDEATRGAVHVFWYDLHWFFIYVFFIAVDKAAPLSVYN